MAWPKSMQLVDVEWVDSHFEAGWQSRDDWKPEETVLLMRSTGWLLHKDKERVVLCGSQSEGGNIDAMMHIPRAAVRRITELVSKGATP